MHWLTGHKTPSSLLTWDITCGLCVCVCVFVFVSLCMCVQYVAAFAVSSISSNWERIGKPFNPLLGETYEFER